MSKPGFCSQSGSLGKDFGSYSSISALTEAASSWTSISPREACDLMGRYLSLKESARPKPSGKVSRESVRLVTDSVVDRLHELSAVDITTIVRGVGDSSSSVDEYLMFVLAEAITRRIEEFEISELLRVLAIYCKRDLIDEDLLEAIVATVAIRASEVSLSNLIGAVRDLGTVNFPSPDLTAIILERLPTAHMSPKDVVSALIGLTHLDCLRQLASPTSRLWELFRRRPNSPLSHDDEYGLIAAAIYCPDSFALNELLPRVVEKARKENRIQKRIRLLKECLDLGVLPASEPLSSSLRNLPPVRRPRATVSSGLHLEVAEVLRGMNVKTQLESPVGSFVVDIHIPSIS